MKGIVVINGYASGEKFLRQGERIAQALRNLSLSTELVRNGELAAAMGEDGKISLAERYDFAVYLDKDKYLGRALELAGVRLFNSAAAVEACDDKFTTYLALSGSGLTVAKSVAAPLCYTQGAQPKEEFLKRVADELGFPLVAKKSYGSFGEGVQLVPGYAELRSIEEKWLHIPHFYQRYIAKGAGRDTRVMVIGGRAVAAMTRIAKAGEFRSNIELGGRGEAVALSPSYARAAEGAARALGLDYCGVDLLEGEEGPVVCEVNSNAFFEGLEAATGVDIARAYATHIRDELLKAKK